MAKKQIGSAWMIAGAVVVLGILAVLVWLSLQLTSQTLGLMGSAIRSRRESWMSDFLVESAAIGVVTMALIQVMRGVYPIRGLFHRRMVTAWLQDSKTDLLEDLVRLAVTQDSRRLFDLPLEQLCGQISAAAERVIDHPEGKTALLQGLAGLAGTKDLQAIEDLLKYADDWKASKDLSVDDSRRQEFLARRNRLAQSIQRNIDGLQISVSAVWRRSLRVAAIVISGLLAYAISAGSTAGASPNTGPGFQLVFYVMIAGLLGGFFATVARDLVAAVEKLRR